MSEELTMYESKPLTANDIKSQVALIQDVMKSVMRDKEHYGVIPGCGDKPALLKPGAEKLNFTFRMAPDPETQIIDLGGGHREYRVKCIMRAIETGRTLGAGVGSASTMETKWRYRNAEPEVTGKPVPTEYWEARKKDPAKALELIGGKGFTTKKVDNSWWIAKLTGEKVEYDNPADYYNTCWKMAKKRSLVDAVLTVLAASDIFTQDIEEMVENGAITPDPSKKTEAAKPPLKEPEKKATGTPPTQTTPAGSLSARISIKDVIEQTKTKKGEDMKSPLYHINSDSGVDYRSFDKAHADTARPEIGTGVLFDVTYDKTQYGIDLKTIVAMEQGPGAGQ